jgi:cytoskeletal protein CcmA (bactofilin family)
VAISDGSTIIGESIVINGNLNGDEDLTVRGRVEGTITLTQHLLVEASGVVKAEVQVKSCVVSGALVGNVTATESIEITKEGRMVGDIAAPRVVIHDGAGFRGRIDTGEVDVEEAPERPALARAASRPALRPPPPPPPRHAIAPRPALIERPERLERAEEKVEGASLAERAAAAVKPPAPPVPVAMGAVKRKVVVRRK